MCEIGFYECKCSGQHTNIVLVLVNCIILTLRKSKETRQNVVIYINHLRNYITNNGKYIALYYLKLKIQKTVENTQNDHNTLNIHVLLKSKK